MALFLLLVLVAVVLGLVGILANGLFYLLIIGIVVLIIDLIYGSVRMRRGGRRPSR